METKVRDILSNSYIDCTDLQLKEKYEQIKSSNNNTKTSKALIIAIEAIKRVYDYNITNEDLEKLDMFINKTSLNISNSEAFYPFLLYTITKEIENKYLHALFIDDFLARKYFIQSEPFYEFLGIKASFNFINESNSTVKPNIFSANIIFSDWKRIIWEHIYNLNIQKVVDKINLKFDCAFIFDIDRIIYDYEKFTIKFNSNDLNPNEIKVKKFFKLYKEIIGVSPCLFLEGKKIEKNYNIKTQNTLNNKDILSKIKNANEKFYKSRLDKIRSLSKEIELLNNNQETVIIDIDDNEDFELLCEFLKFKNIRFSTIDENTDIFDNDILTILTPNKISIIRNMLNASIESKLGGDYKEIAKINTYMTNADVGTNFYNEKLKKELKEQKEIQEKNKEIIQNEGGINLIFASHYTELKSEYAIIKNYYCTPIKNLTFYNCSEDTVYKEFKLNKLNIFNKQDTQENKILFDIFAKFVFYFKKFAINRMIRQTDDCLVLNVQKNEFPNNSYKEKVGRNDPCPCGSGKKYKNCCGG